MHEIFESLDDAWGKMPFWVTNTENAGYLDFERSETFYDDIRLTPIGSMEEYENFKATLAVNFRDFCEEARRDPSAER